MTVTTSPRSNNSVAPAVVLEAYLDGCDSSSSAASPAASSHGRRGTVTIRPSPHSSNFVALVAILKASWRLWQRQFRRFPLQQRLTGIAATVDALAVAAPARPFTVSVATPQVLALAAAPRRCNTGRRPRSLVALQHHHH
jgi:hypothetical protein